MQGEETITKATVDTIPTPAADNIEPQSDIDSVAANIGLSVQQAAAALGKSLRALERSLIGKWGNKLPQGWQARRVKTENGLEWRLIPPPEFTVKPASKPSASSSLISQLKNLAKDQFQSKYEIFKTVHDPSSDQPTIVIDRGDEVEHLLRELLQTQKQLSEERRQRMDDLRLLTQLQGSMRLLEDKAAQTASLKEELTLTQQEFTKLKQEYLEFLRLPWWKRMFRKS